MKVKTYAMLGLAALIAISASASIAREFFDNQPVAQPKAEVKKQEAKKAEPKATCDARYDYPVSPKDRKRERAIFYWKPAGATYNSQFDGSERDAAPQYKHGKAHIFSDVVTVSDYPCNRCTLNAQGKYELRINRSN